MKEQVYMRNKTTCYHCGEECKDSHIHIDEKPFCCEGCKLVFEILSENDLCNYYDLSKNPGIQVKGKFVSETYAYLDDEQVKTKLITYTDGKQSRVTLYLPKMHCSSCIWLLENLHRINTGIVKSQVDFTRKEINILYNEDTISLRKVVELLAFIGYEPTITLKDLDTKKVKKNNHQQIFKIGIAGFCFGNIMMLSFPEYFSNGNIQQHGLKEFFGYLNLFLSLPVFFYCASDFFISSYKGFKQKFINIEAPIALAVLITFSRSVYEIISGTGVGYMDSMSGIVFFMLLGRYFQNFTYDTLSFERDYKSYFPVAVNLIKNNAEMMVPLSEVKVGDRIRIKNNELLPVDAILFKGEAKIDYSFVTGESEPVSKVLGEIIYAGGKQMGSAIELEVIKEVSQSYLTQLWNNDTFGKIKNDTGSFIHLLGKYFSLFLMVLAAGSFLFWLPTDFHRALNALTAVLIVACPCALLLSATFTNGNILRIFGKNKLYLKNSDVIEKLKNIDTIVFDKTGTITQNDESVVQFEGKVLSEYQLQLVRSLVFQSSHPLSKNILNHLPYSKVLPVENYKEHSGKGIEGFVNGTFVKLGSKQFISIDLQISGSEIKSSHSYLKINNTLYGYFIIKNHFREGLERLIKSMENNYHLIVLSGDNDAEKATLEKLFNGKADLNFNQSPGDKLNYIKMLQTNHHKVAMIGDGLNDAGALQQSDVGIAISDNINNFSPACDAILDGSRFGDLKTFISFASAGNNIIVASFVISLMYNAIGLWFSVTGNLSPVIAAILMPVSSISIVLFTTGASSIAALRKKL
jgi:Cu+-exporting ATPase